MQKDSELLIESINQNDANSIPFNAKNLKLSYQINIESIYENNNLMYHPKIIKPNLNKNIEQLSSINENEIFVFENAKNKIIKPEVIFIRNIKPDGNCYYRSLSYFLTNNEKYYEYLRNYIYTVFLRFISCKNFNIYYLKLNHKMNLTHLKEKSFYFNRKFILYKLKR